jgi:hypothetical protein
LTTPYCDECYKALIFFGEGSYSKETVENFLDIIDSFEVIYIENEMKASLSFILEIKTKCDFFKFFGK